LEVIESPSLALYTILSQKYNKPPIKLAIQETDMIDQIGLAK
jgi:hypothetical protein